MIKPELCKDKKSFKNIDLSEYIAEKKYDGERIIAIKKGNKISLQRKSGKDATNQYPEIVNALKSFEYDIILDGEMCVFIGEQENFQEGSLTRIHLKNDNKIYQKSRETPATYIVFDVLKAGLVDLKEKSLLSRKEHLEVFFNQSILNTSAEQYIKLISFVEDGEELFKQAKEKNWEGIILKPKVSSYIENSRKQWVKIKHTFDADFIFHDYEENNRGIKLFKYDVHKRDDIILDVDPNNPIIIQCTGEQSNEVKACIDNNGEVYITVGYLNKTSTNRLRMPVFKKLVEI